MVKKPEEWITTKEAARILTENSGHPVSEAYVRLLARQGKLLTRPLDARTKLYNRYSVQGYKVEQRGKKEVGELQVPVAA